MALDIKDTPLFDLVRRFVKNPIEARTGPLLHRARHRRAIRGIPPTRDAIRHLEESGSLTISAPRPAPVFVLSAGWRSGSTLLQRLVMSAGDILVWGEPYDRCCHVQRLAATLGAFDGEWPPDRFFLGVREEKGATDHTSEWVASLYPGPDDLKASHQAFFDRLFDRPARARGYGRWGMKEVRLDAGHARYLRWLYPDARFLFLVRNPFAAYRSYRLFRPWYDLWPEGPVFTPGDFGRHWVRLAGSFVRAKDELGGRLIRFEDLVRRDIDLSELSEYLDLELDAEILMRRVTGRGDAKLVEVPRVEQRLLRRVVAPVARDLGYEVS